MQKLITIFFNHKIIISIKIKELKCYIFVFFFVKKKIL